MKRSPRRRGSAEAPAEYRVECRYGRRLLEDVVVTATHDEQARARARQVFAQRHGLTLAQAGFVRLSL